LYLSAPHSYQNAELRILRLALLGRLAVKVLVSCVGVSASSVDGPINVLRWSVDRVEPKGLRPRAYHVVTRALRHNNTVIGFDFVTCAVDPNFTLARFDTEELVAVIMDLLSNLVTWLDGHEDKLKIVASVENATEVVVLFRKFLDIVNKAPHPYLPFAQPTNSRCTLKALATGDKLQCRQ